MENQDTFNVTFHRIEGGCKCQGGWSYKMVPDLKLAPSSQLLQKLHSLSFHPKYITVTGCCRNIIKENQAELLLIR